MPENRRVRMTKKLMQDALVELLEQKPLAKISVTDVCAAADVNRSTFYAYYQDVAGLLREVEEDAMAAMPATMEMRPWYTVDELLDIFEEYFAYVKENSRLFRVLACREDSGEFNRRLVESILQKYAKPESVQENPFLLRYSTIFSVYGSVGVMRTWIEEGFPVSPRKFSEIMLKMCIQATDIQDIKLD